MSILRPETAEDRMAMVPLLFCALPLLIAVVAVVALVVWWLS